MMRIPFGKSSHSALRYTSRLTKAHEMIEGISFARIWISAPPLLLSSLIQKVASHVAANSH
jgi:hypothetical protein